MYGLFPAHPRREGDSGGARSRRERGANRLTGQTAEGKTEESFLNAAQVTREQARTTR